MNQTDEQKYYEEEIEKHCDFLAELHFGKWMERDIQAARNTAEIIALLERELKKAEVIFSDTKGKDSYYTENYLQLLQQKIGIYQRTLEMERPGLQSSADCQYPHNSEQEKAYHRVTELLKSHHYWAGSLSDFVYMIDTLALHGYLRANELEEALAESFSHKPQGKKKIQRLTADKIKDRRRNMKIGHNTVSPEIVRTVDRIVKKMKSER